MKDYKSLAGAVIRIAIMIGAALWFNNPPNDNGGLCIVNFLDSLKK